MQESKFLFEAQLQVDFGLPVYDFYNTWGVEDSVWHKGVPDEKGIDAAPIVIENDVWIASNVLIKEGVRLGNGAVVAGLVCYQGCASPTLWLEAILPKL